MRILLIVMCFLFCSQLSAAIIHIPADQPAIQTGINVSVDGDTILVQPGIYYENIDYFGKEIVVSSLFLTTQDTMYISQTIIDGNQYDSVVSFHSEETLNSMLIGFTITDGNDFEGGGIECRSGSSPYLANIVLNDNFAENNGGGLSCSYYSNPSLINVTINNNHSANTGGGIYCSHYSNPSIKESVISNNSSIHGGGIYCFQNSSVNLENVTVSNNSADIEGGGIVLSGSSSSFINVLISGNNALYKGGGLFNTGSITHLHNVTISGNSANEGGGIWSYYNSVFELVNCVLWDNLPGEIYFDSDCDPSIITISYSDIEDGESGIITNNNCTVNWLDGNIAENPLFDYSSNHPYSLQNESPCINSATLDTTGLNLPDYDLAGNIRIFGGRVDMGAYENQNIIVNSNDNIIPQVAKLYQNYPNPFNPTTTIEFSIQNDSEVDLTIFNIKGQKIKTVACNEFPKGSHSINWNSDDESGKPVSSGIYFFKLNVNGKTEGFKKCLLLK